MNKKRYHTIANFYTLLRRRHGDNWLYAYEMSGGKLVSIAQQEPRRILSVDDCANNWVTIYTGRQYALVWIEVDDYSCWWIVPRDELPGGPFYNLEWRYWTAPPSLENK